MEKIPQTPPKSPAGDRTYDQNTPPPPNKTGSPKSRSPICSGRKTGTPDRLKVPKAFKYPERYKSPTDQMISPVTRGILARTKTGRKLLPPTIQPKIEALKLMETSRFQLEKC
ncbi:uncharacterized protein LOC142550304 [Primulina tabacum]|uniref:uncharacterized protein LOC142550304 n=1 Tax=Primulina tabacum TaxID=48773 RepID=UPI003F5A4412